MSNIQQKPDQATALPDPVPVLAPTNPRKPARGKPQLKFFRGRFWDVYPNGDVIPARDEDEPEEEVVQLAVSTSTVPPQSAPTCTPSQPPAPSYPTTDTTTQVARGETVTVPASIIPQLPARLQHLPPQPLKLKQDTIQPATHPVNETHSRRKIMQQPVGIEARPVKKRKVYQDPFNSFAMSSRDEPINLRTAPSDPTAPAATPLTYEQTARDHARPASRGGTSMTDRRHRNHTLGEPVEGETWPDAPTIGVSNFKLARSMPRRPPKKGLVRLNGSKSRICDNAGCSAYHSHKDCTMPRQCKGCGSPKHFWGGCNRSCNLCGAQQHTAELCFTIPVGEDRKQRSGNPDDYRQ